MQTRTEGIAEITPESVGAVRVVGRDEYGNPIEEKLPSKPSKKMLNTSGAEVWVAIQNHRLNDPRSYELYGRRHLEDRIAAGFLPKDECPLTQKYAHLVPGGGSLVKPLDGEQPCGELPPATTQALDWHGCPHYIRARDERRRRAAEDVKQTQAAPTQEALRMLREATKAGAQEVLEEMQGAKGRMRGGR